MEYKVIPVIWSVLLTWMVLKTTAGPGGSVIMRLNSLHNPNNKNYKNKCCDGTSGRSCEPCAYQLEIWVNCDGRRDNTDCFYGYTKTGVFPSGSHVIFNDTLGNEESNPLVYNFSLFKGTFGYQIEAKDGSGVKIDDYKRHVPLYPSKHVNRKWTNLTQTSSGASGSSLDVSYSVFCNAHYYGPSCIVGCPPGKTYKCDPNTGKKLCNAGWLGPNCDCRMTHKNTCGPKGEKICYPPWYGDNCHVKCVAQNDRLAGYSCNRITGGKICLSGWYGEECNQTVAIVPRMAMRRVMSTATPTRVMSSVDTFMKKQQASDHSGQSTTENIMPVLATRMPPRNRLSCPYPSCQMTSLLVTSYPLRSDSVITWTSTEMILSGSSGTIRMSPIMNRDSATSGSLSSSSSGQLSLTSEPRSSQEIKTVSKRIDNTITEKQDSVEQTIIFKVSATTTLFSLDQSSSQGRTTECKDLEDGRNTAQLNGVNQSKSQLSTTRTHLRIPEEYTVKEEQGEIAPQTKPKATATTTLFSLDQSSSQGRTTECKDLEDGRNTAQLDGVNQSKSQLSTTRTHLRIPEEYTVKEEQGEIAPQTKPEATATTGNSITHASMRRTYSITYTTQVSDTIPEETTTHEPGSSEARTSDDTGRLVLLHLLASLAVAFLVIGGLALIRKKTRKRRKVFPHVPPRQLELRTRKYRRATENDKIHSNRNILKVMPMANDHDEWQSSKTLPVQCEI